MGRRRLHRGPYRVGDEEDEEPRVVTAAQRLEAATLDRLQGDGRVRTAAVVAETFHLDPAALLAEPDRVRRLVRIAAHNIIVRQHNRRHGG